jgi:hypothetical protein
MSISKKALDELRKLYKEEIGKEMSPDVALEAGTWLLEKVKAVAQPIPEDKFHVFERIKEELLLIRSLSRPLLSPDREKDPR